ncbi:MAG: nicotinamide-nucleotide adenylyltransferase [Methanobrevibacter sp.]|jgi:nicotinamide-nucleotide adenylyltransferase|nr:nicotinamide-nucleotide adenylyltransferase [Candidatus Methanoflexus mossambicus]
MGIKRGILIGRMQPPHNGHLEIIKQSFEDIDELIIGIGSSQMSHSQSNPFTAGERVLMLKKALSEQKIPGDSYYLIPIPDIMKNSVWVSHVENLCPKFNVVYSGNPLIQRLFKEKNYNVEIPPLIDRKNLSGRDIRFKMLNNENWEEFVPKSVLKTINKIDGVNRLKEISSKEINEI